MGGLWRKMPITFVTFVIAHVGAGRHPAAGRLLVEGRDHRQRGAQRLHVFMIIGLVGAFLTAAYMTRCVYLTFLGKPRGARPGSRPTATRSTRSTTTGCPSMPAWLGATVTAARADRHPGRGRDRRGPATRRPAGHVVPSRRPRPTTASTRAPTSPTGSSPSRSSSSPSARSIAGFLQAPAFTTEKFKEWVEPAGVTVLYDQAAAVQAGQEPDLTAGGGEAATCAEQPLGRLGLLRARAQPLRVRVVEGRGVDPARAAGIAVSGLVCWAFYERKSRFFVGLTERSRLAAGRLHVPDQQVLPRLPVREGGRRRHLGARSPPS